MELLSTFEYENFKLELYYRGSHILPNKVYINGNLVLEDDSFRPSPFYDIDSPECIISLLGFYAAANELDWEVPKEIIDWVEEHGEEVNLMINDFELSDDKEWLKDNQISWEEATQILNFIKIE